MNIERILEKLQDAKETSNGWQAKCPAHDDRRASLCIHQTPDDKILMKCQAGCETPDVLKAIGLKLNDLFPEKERPAARPKKRGSSSRNYARGKIVATYDYEHESGELNYQVQRSADKHFVHRHRRVRNGVAEWVYNAQGKTRTLYRLPKIKPAIAEGRPIYLVEGEKDVHTLEAWGLTATTKSGGSTQKWLDSFSQSLAGADIIIIPDNDDPGKKSAEIAACNLLSTAKRVRAIELPNAKEHGDITDWAEAGGTLEGLIALQDAAADFQPGSIHPEYVAPKDIINIDVKNRPLREMGQKAIGALNAKNNPPYFFLRHGDIVRFRETETGIPLIERATDGIVTSRLADICDFTSDTNEGLRHHSPPKDVVRYVLSSDSLPFPKLIGITESPLLRADGTILQAPGYDSATGYLYTPLEGFEMPELPLNPTKKQVKEAVALVKEVFCDFPFVDEASRTNTIALMLTPLLKTIVPKTPLALVDATKWGTGKSLLAETCATISAGGYSLTTPPTDSEEWRKKITSLLMDGKPYIILDNLKHMLKSDSLAALLTSATWTDRILGNSQTTSIANNSVWVVTGNNIQTDGEIARRSYLIRIDAQTSAPHERDVNKFLHPNLAQWVAFCRGEILAGLFTIIRAWIVANKPLVDTPRMGSFETWTETVGSILAFVGIAGFMGNKDALMKDADAESQQWEAFLQRWEDLYGDMPQTVAQIKEKLTSPDGFGGTLPEVLSYAIKGDNVNCHKVGKALKAKECTRFGKGCYRLESAGEYQHALRWVVKSGEYGESGESGSPVRARENVLNHDKNICVQGLAGANSPNSPNSPTSDFEEF